MNFRRARQANKKYKKFYDAEVVGSIRRRKGEANNARKNDSFFSNESIHHSRNTVSLYQQSASNSENKSCSSPLMNIDEKSGGSEEALGSGYYDYERHKDSITDSENSIGSVSEGRSKKVRVRFNRRLRILKRRNVRDQMIGRAQRAEVAEKITKMKKEFDEKIAAQNQLDNMIEKAGNKDSSKSYMDPLKHVRPGHLSGVEMIVNDNFLWKSGKIERRIYVDGSGGLFQVIENSKWKGSLWRALAIAITGHENDYNYIYMETIQELNGRPHMYPPITTNAVEGFQEKVKGISFKKAPDFTALMAAAQNFKFRFVLYSILDQDFVQCKTFEAFTLPEESIKATYYFLRSGHCCDDWCYELLNPLRPVEKAINGTFPYRNILTSIFQMTEYQNHMFEKYTYTPSIPGDKILAVGLCARTFIYRQTLYHDIWSLLAEILFNKIIRSPECKGWDSSKRGMYSPIEAWRFIFKAYDLNENAFSSFLKMMKDSNSGTHDEEMTNLEMASKFFAFSYTLIGSNMYSKLFWKTNLSNKDKTMWKTVPRISSLRRFHLAFLLKCEMDRAEWHLLHEIPDSDITFLRSFYKERDDDFNYEFGNYAVNKCKFVQFGHQPIRSPYLPTSFIIRHFGFIGNLLIRFRVNVEWWIIFFIYMAHFFKWLITNRTTKVRSKCLDGEQLGPQPGV